MPHGPWGYGMSECIAWVKRNRKEVDDPGAYCAAIKIKQGGAKKALDLKEITYADLIPLSDEELGTVAESLKKADDKDDTMIDAALMLWIEMEDRGIEPASFFGPEIERWIPDSTDKAVPLANIYRYMPRGISKADAEVMLMGEAVERGFVGRYGKVILRVNKAERDVGLEHEIIAGIGCPHVSRKVEFVWGVDPADESILPLYKDGALQINAGGCGCGEVDKAVWTTAYVNDLPDSSFAYISPGGSKDSGGKTTPRGLRHLPYKDSNGKADAAHVRNALARLNQTHIPASAKAAARRKLASAARGLGIKVSEKSLYVDYTLEQQSWTEVSGSGMFLKAVPRSHYVLKAVLSTEARKKIPKGKFAYVDDKGVGHLPIHDARHVRNAMARFNQTHMPEGAKAGAKGKICAAAKRFGIDSEWCGSKKAVTVPESFDRMWVIEGDPAGVGKARLVEDDEPHPSKNMKVIKTGEDEPLMIYRDGRNMVLEFGGYMLVESKPMSAEWTLSPSTPENTFPYSLHKDTSNDLTSYKLFICKGDVAESLTLSKDIRKLSGPEQFLHTEYPDAGEVEYEGRRRRDGKMITTEIIASGNLMIVDNVLKMGDREYTVDWVRGTIDNK